MSLCDHKFIVKFVRNRYTIYLNYESSIFDLSNDSFTIIALPESGKGRVQYNINDFPKTNKIDEESLNMLIKYVYSYYENMIFS